MHLEFTNLAKKQNTHLKYLVEAITRGLVGPRVHAEIFKRYSQHPLLTVMLGNLYAKCI